MRKILIATHGHLASGVKSSIELLTGYKDEIYIIDAYLDENDISIEFNKFIDTVSPEDEVVIFTDLKGGSVNQRIINIIPKKLNAYIIAGFNLPAILEIILSDELSKEIIDEKIEICRNELVRIQTICEDSIEKRNENYEVSTFLGD